MTTTNGSWSQCLPACHLHSGKAVSLPEHAGSPSSLPGRLGRAVTRASPSAWASCPSARASPSTQASCPNTQASPNTRASCPSARASPSARANPMELYQTTTRAAQALWQLLRLPKHSGNCSGCPSTRARQKTARAVQEKLPKKKFARALGQSSSFAPSTWAAQTLGQPKCLGSAVTRASPSAQASCPSAQASPNAQASCPSAWASPNTRASCRSIRASPSARANPMELYQTTARAAQALGQLLGLPKNLDNCSGCPSTRATARAAQALGQLLGLSKHSGKAKNCSGRAGKVSQVKVCPSAWAEQFVCPSAWAAQVLGQSSYELKYEVNSNLRGQQFCLTSFAHGKSLLTPFENSFDDKLRQIK